MSEVQRREIIEWIQEAKVQGMSIERACEVLGLAPQRFYRWLKGLDQTKRFRGGWNRVLAEERKAIREMGELHPELDHRKMSFELETFRRCVDRCAGNYKIQSVSCLDQYLSLAFAQLTYRGSLREIEACLYISELPTI